MQLLYTRVSAFAALLLISLMVCGTVSARWGDGTGPAGQGPKTGRGLGRCTGNAAPGYQNTSVPRLGNGYRRFGGRGRGQRNVFNATGLRRCQRSSTGAVQTTVQKQPAPNVSASATQKQSVEVLKKQAETLKQELGVILKKIETLESGAKK